jgi:hypothetical protein
MKQSSKVGLIYSTWKNGQGSSKESWSVHQFLWFISHNCILSGSLTTCLVHKRALNYSHKDQICFKFCDLFWSKMVLSPRCQEHKSLVSLYHDAKWNTLPSLRDASPRVADAPGEGGQESLRTSVVSLYFLLSREANKSLLLQISLSEMMKLWHRFNLRFWSKWALKWPLNPTNEVGVSPWPYNHHCGVWGWVHAAACMERAPGWAKSLPKGGTGFRSQAVTGED